MDSTKRPQGVNEALYNANPVITNFIVPDDTTVSGEWICFRVLGDSPTLTACLFKLNGTTVLDLSSLDGFDNGDWHWIQFDELVTVSSSDFLIECVRSNSRTV